LEEKREKMTHPPLIIYGFRVENGAPVDTQTLLSQIAQIKPEGIPHKESS